MMIRSLVKSAFQTGCLSVASEGLIHQMLTTRCYQSDDLLALADLDHGIRIGTIKREASFPCSTPFATLRKSR